MKTRLILGAALAAILTLALSGAGPQSADELYKSGLYEEEVGGDLQKAIGIYQDLLKRFPGNLEIAAKAQLRVGFCYEKMGTQDAERAFQRVIDNYPGQAEAVRVAKEKLARLRQARAIVEKGARESTVRHVLTWNDLSINGSISPDERYISLTDWNTGDLALRELATGKERRLTNKGIWDRAHPGYASKSLWSPDSRRVAYTWVNANNETELHEVGITDPLPRVIRGEERGVWLTPIEWSSDGKDILANEYSQIAVNLSLISVADGSKRTLKTFPDRNVPPGNAFLSPGGRYVAYSYPPRGDSRSSDIFLLTVADDLEIPLVQHPAHDNLLGWLPDGRGILFASDRSGRIDAWVLLVKEGGPLGSPTMVKRNIGTVDPMVMTREGRFYYSTPGAVRTIYSATLDPQTGRLINPPAKEPLTYEGNNFWPAWSPDGKTLAYTSWRELAKRESVLCLYSAGPKELREVSLTKRLGHPGWTMDGRRLLLQAAFIDGGGIYELDVESEAVTPLISEGELYSAFVSPDRKIVIYGREDGKEKSQKILVRDLASGQDRELARTPHANNSAAVSPDGQHVAMLLRTEENLRVLQRMDFPDGTPTEILRFKQGGAFIISLAWSPDSRWIYFSENTDDDSDWDLWRVPREGGQGQNLGITMRRFDGLSFHPDGRRITFASVPPDREFPQLWVMENFLPPALPVPEKVEKEFTMRRVYDGGGLEWGNALSSDGRYLVYTNWDTGDLAVMNLMTKTSRALTRNGGLSAKSGEMGETSAFSPDDKRVAYGWRNKDKVPELWVIGSDGSAPRMLFRDEKSGWIRPHAWSPDGRQILAINMKKDGPSQIILVSATDGTVRTVRDIAWQDPDLDLSPDGRFIACTMGPDPSSSKQDIFIVKIENGERGPLVAHDADDYSLGWAPDGKTLLFASDRSGSYGLWAVDVSDGRAAGSPYLIKAAINKVEPVRLAPNGALYSVQTEEVVDIFTAAVDPLTGKVQGQPKAVPTRTTGANILAVWSPDGAHLAYLTRPGGLTGPNWPAVISILDMRTGEERQVAAKIGSMIPGQGFGWAPDGRSMLIIGRTGEQTAIYKVDIVSGAASPLVIIPKFQYTMSAAWSADGTSIFYPQGNPTRILRRDLDTGKDSELATMTGPAGIATVAPSPDGRWLAFTSREEGNRPTQIKIVPSLGGEVRELFRVPDKGLVMELIWTPNSRHLWFRIWTPSEDPKVSAKVESWRVSPEDGTLQKLELDVNGAGVRLHPDGRQIVFMKGGGRRDLWVMENFLPVEKAKK